MCFRSLSCLLSVFALSIFCFSSEKQGMKNLKLSPPFLPLVTFTSCEKGLLLNRTEWTVHVSILVDATFSQRSFLFFDYKS